MGMNRKRYLAFFVALVVALFTLAFPRLLHAPAEAQYAFDDSDSPTLNVSPFQSDDFNTCALDTGVWTFTNPLGDSNSVMTGTHVVISVTEGIDHDIWSTNPDNFANNSARIMQPAEDVDFEVEVKFDSGFTGQYQMQGVLIEEDANDLLRLEFHRYQGSTMIFVAAFESGVVQIIRERENIGDGSIAPMYMRVKREADQWTQSYSFDAEQWHPFTFTHSMTVTAVGTYAGNTADPPAEPPSHTAKIDYFFNTASPIVPEDAIVNTLTVTKVGHGEVITEPAKAAYTCGEVVTLTATADPWWSFGGWSGDLLGSDNPETLTIAGPQVVTATFTQNEYTLTVERNPPAGGTVALGPTPGPYHYGDVVTLTATANPGWTFANWSGGLTSTANPVTTTITDHTTVTVTFNQNDYTLTVNADPVSGGWVGVTPMPGHYHYGDVVTLTAIPVTGWAFAGWSGALSGITNPATVTIAGSTAITAAFQEGQYTLTATVVGGGNVAKNPDRVVYRYGDVVTLTATADPHWTFASWSGALTSTVNPATATITRSIAVTATFTRNRYTLTVNKVGSGSVAVKPTPGPYYYGTVITLTATASPTWAFAGWSGDLIGTANPETTTITSHTMITATFTTHRVFLPLVVRNS